MLKRDFVIGTVLIILLAYGLLSCNSGKASPNVLHAQESTGSQVLPDLPQNEMASPEQTSATNTPHSTPLIPIEEIFKNIDYGDILQPTHTPTPSPTPTLSPKLLCQPFPESMLFLGSGAKNEFPLWTVRSRCNGEVTYFRSPVGEMTLLDYTPLTGRFAYGPPAAADVGLWVYDFWTELSEKWLDEPVRQAQWAPVRNPQGEQILAVLTSDGALAMASLPFQFTNKAENVTHFSFSPSGDRLAYVKNEVLFVVNTSHGEPRKLAEEVYGNPVWAKGGTVIIVPSIPVKIIDLTGPTVVIPQERPSVERRIAYLCNGRRSCSFSTQKAMDRLLWNGRTNLLTFYSLSPTDKEKFRTVYVYELSEDLRQIVNRQTIFGDFTNHIEWDIPGESLIDSAHNQVRIGPPDEVFFTHAKINSIENNLLGVEFNWTNSWITSRYGHQFLQVILTDQSYLFDVNGDRISRESLKLGMTIGLTARRLSPSTLSLFGYTIQIICDETPCYLGFEG